MSDERDRAGEPNGQVRCLRRDDGSISFKDAPVDAAIGITVCLERRQDRAALRRRLKRREGSRSSATETSVSLGATASSRSLKTPRGQSKTRLIFGLNPRSEL